MTGDIRTAEDDESQQTKSRYREELGRKGYDRESAQYTEQGLRSPISNVMPLVGKFPKTPNGRVGCLSGRNPSRSAPRKEVPRCAGSAAYGSTDSPGALQGTSKAGLRKLLSTCCIHFILLFIIYIIFGHHYNF